MPSPTLHVDDAPCSPEVLAQIQDALESGQTVLLPTETVYGIAARADQPAALEALARAKGRPSDQPFTWHVADTACLDALGARTAPVERLVERYWPGPLTLVLPNLTDHLPHLSKDGRIGVRLPSHRATASILDALPFPVAMTSANLHGEPPIQDPANLAPSISEALALRVEAGSPGLGESSSVLRLGRAANEDRAAFELLREGLHDLAALRRTAGIQLLFVCTGNICRSPLAEGMARRAIASRLGCTDHELHEFGFRVSSAGTFASPGCPASQHSLDQLELRDIDLSAHGASQTSSQTLADSDRIYCLAHSHLDAVRQLLPKRLKPNALLLDPNGADVPDPIGGSSAEYARCAKQIEELITARLDEWV